jgi:hypothetical protein
LKKEVAVSHRPAIRRLALLLSLFVLAALIVALPVTPLGGNRQQAQASVTAGAVVYQRDYVGIYQWDGSGGALIEDDSSAQYPDMSPDGSKVVFVTQRAPDYAYDLWTVNSDDGSGDDQITQRIEAEDNLGAECPRPDRRTRWSPGASGAAAWETS